jgi:hypothetical protein
MVQRYLDCYAEIASARIRQPVTPATA